MKKIGQIIAKMGAAVIFWVEAKDGAKRLRDTELHGV